MRGVITTVDLFTCAPLILRYFGARTYIRCLYRALCTRRPCTFLECL